jgi:hypothetical protein
MECVLGRHEVSGLILITTTPTQKELLTESQPQPGTKKVSLKIMKISISYNTNPNFLVHYAYGNT